MTESEPQPRQSARGEVVRRLQEFREKDPKGYRAHQRRQGVLWALAITLIYLTPGVLAEIELRLLASDVSLWSTALVGTLIAVFIVALGNVLLGTAWASIPTTFTALVAAPSLIALGFLVGRRIPEEWSAFARWIVLSVFNTVAGVLVVVCTLILSFVVFWAWSWAHQS